MRALRRCATSGARSPVDAYQAREIVNARLAEPGSNIRLGDVKWRSADRNPSRGCARRYTRRLSNTTAVSSARRRFAVDELQPRTREAHELGTIPSIGGDRARRPEVCARSAGMTRERTRDLGDRIISLPMSRTGGEAVRAADARGGMCRSPCRPKRSSIAARGFIVDYRPVRAMHAALYQRGRGRPPASASRHCSRRERRFTEMLSRPWASTRPRCGA